MKGPILPVFLGILSIPVAMSPAVCKVPPSETKNNFLEVGSAECRDAKWGEPREQFEELLQMGYYLPIESDSLGDLVKRVEGFMEGMASRDVVALLPYFEQAADPGEEWEYYETILDQMSIESFRVAAFRVLENYDWSGLDIHLVIAVVRLVIDGRCIETTLPTLWKKEEGRWVCGSTQLNRGFSR